MLENVRIVLVETTHPGNIGAAARAMKNMGLLRLFLVQPHRYPSHEATARAAGADDVLANARICDSLDEALEGCGVVFGASARSRSIPWPQLDPRRAAARAVLAGGAGEAAFVFGREHAGLTNLELDRCNYLVTIPADPAFASLNVAAAVQVLSYELRVASQDAVPPAADGEPLASAEERERFYRHLEQVLTDLEFLNPDNPKHLMRRLRRLFNRVELDCNEVNILRGILTAVERRGTLAKNERPKT
jgi:tRNA (cytidine32/uridine32-2'-O)-methyltransferase